MTIQAYFTGKVDHRFAWLGNDAVGSFDILAELASLIGSATSSIAVSTMTFNYTAGATPADAKIELLADLLAQKAQAGLNVRIVGNSGHRYQDGYFRALRGPLHIADNNLPALLHRISFQRASTPAPAGFLVDAGDVYGLRASGLYYGWDSNASGDIGPHGSVPAGFTSPLLGECYARINSSATRTWRIQLPAGHYYLHVATGEAAYNSKTFVLAQGTTPLFLRKNLSGNYQYFDNTNTGAGEFACSTVDGGTDPGTGLPMGQRLEVTAAGGTLDITVGRVGQASYSSIDYIEIYRASDTYPYGDPGLDKSRVQDRALHHSKFVLVDADTATPRLWNGSHNLTPVDPTDPSVRSEDAIFTDEPAICAAFASEFNQWWGAPAGPPAPAASRTGIFKVPVLAAGAVPSSIPGVTAQWKVRFSPSVNTAPGVDMYQTVADFLNSATEDVILLIEQVTDGGTFVGPFGTFLGPTGLINLLRNKALSGDTVQGLFGNTDMTDGIFTSLAGIATAKVGSSTLIHDKFACVDALRDNPSRHRGKVLCGSMNWSQGALHTNDEQTLIIEDPAIANQYLQRAASAFTTGGIALSRAADCVVVIDRSYSMNQAATTGSTKIAAARLAAKVFLDLLDHSGKHRVSLVRFGVSVEPFAPPLTPVPLNAAAVTQLEAAIDGIVANLPIGNWTCYGLPLQEAFDQLTALSAANPRQLIVFLSDGMENQPPWSSTVYPAIAAQGIELHTTSFGIAGQTADAILSTMATASGGSFAHVDDDTIHLQKRFADVARDAQNMVTILDPSWTLAAGQGFVQEFPVDMAKGTLLIVLLWGGQSGGVEKVSVRTPWGAVLTPRSPGVKRTTGEGREVWKIDLLRAGGKTKREVRGMWKVAARGSKAVEKALRVDLCVFASDEGLARLVTDLVPVEAGRMAFRFRVWGGDQLAEKFSAKVTHILPYVEEKGGPRPQAAVRFSKMQEKDPRWRGVRTATLDVTKSGAHEIRIVAEGTVVNEVVKRGSKRAKKLNVPFRREQVVQWVQVEKSLEKIRDAKE